MTGVWVTNDTITAARMNEKSIFQGTGAAISGLTTYAGMIVFCTSTGSGFTIERTYQRDSTNSSWRDITPNTSIQEITYATTFTTASGTFVDVTGCTVTLPTRTNGKAFVSILASWSINGADSAIFNIMDNAVAGLSRKQDTAGSGVRHNTTMNRVTTLGGQVVKLQTATASGNTISVYGTTDGRPTTISTLECA